MKTQSLFAAVAGGLMVGGAHGAILQTSAGGTATGGGVGTVIFDTSNDTADWINDFGDVDDAGTLYYGFDMTVTDNAGEAGGAGGFFTALQLFNGGAEALGVGNQWLGENLSTFRFPAGAPNENDIDLGGGVIPYAIGQAVRFVVRIDFGANGDDNARVWVNPASEADASFDLGPGDAGFDAVNIRAGNGSGSADYTNIVFATTFDEAAVPEPGSLGLLGLGGLALLRRRR